MSRHSHSNSSLADLDLFADSTREELETAERFLTPVTVQAGQVLLREGGIGDQFLIVADGLVSVTTSDDGHDKVLATVGAGDVLGEMALLYGTPRSATATTIAPTTVFAATPREFYSLLKAVPSVALRIKASAGVRVLANQAA